MRNRTVLFIPLLATLLSCDEPTGPTGRADFDPVASLSASTSSALPGFYFLQPLGPTNTGAGVFDPLQDPIVEICRPSGTGCALPLVVSYTMRAGARSEVVRVSGSQYHVNWKTDQFNLVAGTVYRIRVRVATTVLGYTDISLLSNARSEGTPGTTRLVIGATLPIRFRIEVGAVPPPTAPRAVLIPEAAATGTIGRSGGSLSVTSNGIVYTLSVPPGALPATEQITLTPLSAFTGLPFSGGLAAGVNFAPEGLLFYKPATLTMEFPSGTSLDEVFGFGYAEDGSKIYLKLDSKQGNTISVPVSHFSGAGAAGATLVDIDAIVNSISVNFPSELYPAVMKQVEIQLSEQICGGTDFVFACGDSEAEAESFRDAYVRAAEDVLARWYDDRLKDLLVGATSSDGALSRVGNEYSGGWKGSVNLVFGANPPAGLVAKEESGDDLLAKGYRASFERARANCADSTAVQQFARMDLLSLTGFDFGDGTSLPGDLEDLARTNSCTAFRLSGLPTELPRDTTDALEVQVVRIVGGSATVLAWPEPITLRILPTPGGLSCGSVAGAGSFSDSMDPVSMRLSVTVSTESVAGECTEIAIEISTPYYAPRSNPPPGLFSQPVFGATDTLRVPLPDVDIEVTIDPATAILDAGSTAEFTATVTGTDQTGVTWTVTGGTSSIAGNTLTYTAGNTAGSFTVTARSVDDPDRFATATVEINAGACTGSNCTAITVAPGNALVRPGETRQFTATIPGGGSQAVTWSATGGSISSTGLFTAGTDVGNFRVTAVSVADPSKHGSAGVLVSLATIRLNRAGIGTGSYAQTDWTWEETMDREVDQHFADRSNIENFDKSTSTRAEISWGDQPDGGIKAGVSTGQSTSSQKMIIARDPASAQFLGVDLTASASASVTATLREDGLPVVGVSAAGELNPTGWVEEGVNPSDTGIQFTVTGASVTIELRASCGTTRSGGNLFGYVGEGYFQMSLFRPVGSSTSETGAASVVCNSALNTEPQSTVFTAVLKPGYTYVISWRGHANTNTWVPTSVSADGRFNVVFR